MSRTRKQARGEESRTRLVETTARLLREQGYHATGLNQIVEQSGAPKGSLYHYFPDGKEQLAGEALRLAGDAMLDTLRQLFASCAPGEAVDRLVETAIAELEASDYQHGCPIAPVALETCCSSGHLQQVSWGFFQQVVDLLTRRMTGLGAPPERAAAMAVSMLATYQGALLLSRVQHSPEPLRVAAREMKTYLRAALSP